MRLRMTSFLISGLVLSQLPIPDKICKILYLPRIIELLDLEGSLGNQQNTGCLRTEKV